MMRSLMRRLAGRPSPSLARSFGSLEVGSREWVSKVRTKKRSFAQPFFYWKYFRDQAKIGPPAKGKKGVSKVRFVKHSAGNTPKNITFPADWKTRGENDQGRCLVRFMAANYPVTRETIYKFFVGREFPREQKEGWLAPFKTHAQVKWALQCLANDGLVDSRPPPSEEEEAAFVLAYEQGKAKKRGIVPYEYFPTYKLFRRAERAWRPPLLIEEMARVKGSLKLVRRGQLAIKHDMKRLKDERHAYFSKQQELKEARHRARFEREVLGNEVEDLPSLRSLGPPPPRAPKGLPGPEESLAYAGYTVLNTELLDQMLGRGVRPRNSRRLKTREIWDEIKAGTWIGGEHYPKSVPVQKVGRVRALELLEEKLGITPIFRNAKQAQELGEPQWTLPTDLKNPQTETEKQDAQ